MRSIALPVLQKAQPAMGLLTWTQHSQSLCTLPRIMVDSLLPVVALLMSTKPWLRVQVVVTLAGVAGVTMVLAGASGPMAVVLGGGLALSSTAVAMQVCIRLPAAPRRAFA